MGGSELDSVSFYNQLKCRRLSCSFPHEVMRSTSYCNRFKGKVITMNSKYKYSYGEDGCFYISMA